MHRPTTGTSISIPLRGLWLALAIVCALATGGCKNTPVNVAKGRPNEPESTYFSSDFKPEEQDVFERWSPENITKSMKSAVGLGPDERLARDYMSEGEKHFAAAEYDKAAKMFKAACGRWPDSTLEENAMFLQAESYFFANRYSKANDQYGELIKKYPNTRFLDKTVARKFAIGRFWQQLDQEHHRWVLVPNFFDRKQPMFDTYGHAINAYNDVRINDPRGPLADDAIMAAANAYFVKGRYEDADYYFSLLRTDYPKSDFQLQAHLLGLQCKLLKYQGPEYNGKPLEEAEELTNQILAQFSHELGEERERIVRAKASVRAQRAQRDIHLAQYFDNGKHYGAARIYYAQVMKDYPQTPFAEQAKTRLAAIQGEPDHPPSRLASLTNLFARKEEPSAGGTATASRDNANSGTVQTADSQTPYSPYDRGVAR